MVSKFELSPYSTFIHKSRYARWLEEKTRRENWDETVNRYITYFAHRIPKSDREAISAEIEKTIFHMDVMPSMRAMMTAGPALDKDNAAGFNCSYLAVDDPRAFDEAMYLSMCGTGVGFSVERQYVNQLPIIAENFYPVDTCIKVRDSKIGWSNAFRQLLSLLYSGSIPTWDMSAVRPAGALLKTMGGRASGPEPLDRLFKFSVNLFQKAAGRKLNSIECHDLMCMVADIVVVGGVRRSAMLSLSNLSDERMRNAKNGQWWDEKNPQGAPWRRLANNSVAYTEKPEPEIFIREFLTLIESKSGERGIFNRVSAVNSAKKTGRRKWEGINFGANPCLVGDTLVYVADGRGNIPIQQLALEGKDVPVFCLNDKRDVVIRYMRNPRVTGENIPVYKVTFDDGSSLKVTANHKFLLKSGEYVETSALNNGDSLDILTRFEASIKDIFKANSNSQDYLWVNHGQRKNTAEHRLIAAFHNNTTILKGFIVHHKDFNAQNNTPSNLIIMTKQDHDSLHSQGMLGEHNPMVRAQQEWSPEKWLAYSAKMSKATSGNKNGRYSGYSHKEIKNHALKLTQSLQRRFSVQDWIEYAQQYNLPQAFSGWRKHHLGGIKGLSQWAALQVGLEHIDADPRLVKTYRNLTSQGYVCEIVGNEVLIEKSCEVCDILFKVNSKHREIGVCGHSCASKRSSIMYKNEITTALRLAHKKRKIDIRQQQLFVYSNLKWNLQRVPLKREWKEACKQQKISFEISRSSAPFSSYTSLKTSADSYNHKVVSVELCGTETVYNGTVDEFHNFFVGGFPTKCSNGKNKWVYFNNLQCGEINLRPNQFCNLSEVVIRPHDTKATIKRKVRIAVIIGCLQSTLTDFRYLRKEWQKNTEEERLLGVSLTGIMDNVMMSTNGSDLAKLLDELREYTIEVATEWAGKLGINVPTAITCIKPSGTVSQLVNCSPGIHSRYSRWIKRGTQEDAKSPVNIFLKSIGWLYEPELNKPQDSDLFFFAQESPDTSICRNDRNAIEQLEIYKTYKLHWTEHNPSCTVYVRESEWTDVLAWIYKHFDIIGGVSFLPYDNGIYRQAPFTEITEAEYVKLKEKEPIIDWSKLPDFEKEDMTTASHEMACSAGGCEV